MNNIELEKNSAPILEFFEEREIETVAFDIDNTVLDTSSHFHNILYPLGLEIASILPEEIAPHFFEEMTRQIEKEVYMAYHKNNRKPVLIGREYEDALKEYLQYLELGDVTDQMKEVISYYEWKCYNISPNAYQATKELLELIINAEKKIVFNSHAEDPWTNIKVRHLADLVGSEPFPYVVTSIERKKDVKSWVKSIYMTDSLPEATLCVGDNFYADIIPAQQAGCKNLVWINHRDEIIPSDFILGQDSQLHIIEDISELKNISSEIARSTE